MGAVEKGADAVEKLVKPDFDSHRSEKLISAMSRMSLTRPVAGVTENTADLLRLRWEIF
jgi:hypothetical protein